MRKWQSRIPKAKQPAGPPWRDGPAPDWHVEQCKELVDQALDEYEAALNAYEIFMAEWRLRQLGLGPDGFPLKQKGDDDEAFIA